jgi:hypothetical protein
MLQVLLLQLIPTSDRGFVLSLVGVALSLVGVALSLVGVWLSYKSIKLSVVSEEALSTRYLGQFPDYLPVVQEVIRNTRHSLKILAGVPSHGSFSKADDWISIENELKKLKFRRSPCEAILLYTDKDGRSIDYKTVHRGLVDPGDWHEYRSNHWALIKSFLGNAVPVKDPKDLTLDQWIDLRLKHDEDVVSKVYGHFKLCPGKTIYPIFCWIGDSEAVFSLKAEDNKAHYMAAGFYTRDGHILETLRSTFQFYMDEYNGSKKNSAAIDSSGSHAQANIT